MPTLTRADAPRLPRIVWLAALALALIALGFYLRTLHPGVGPSLDSMELQIAAVTQGVIHPPGSPQYLVLGRLAMLILPGPNPAYRLNLFSALCSAGTVAVLFLLTYRLSRSAFATGFAALSYGLAIRVWYQSSISELYALNALYIALVLYLLVAWNQTSRPGLYWGAAAIYALSFGNHVSMILLLPGFLYAVAITDRKMLTRPRHLAITVGIVLLAAAQYLYIPLRAAANPPFCNYCPGEDITLLDYLTGGPFKRQMLALPWDAVVERVLESFKQWHIQFMPWGYTLGIIGWWELFRKQPTTAWLLTLALGAEYVFLMGYDIPDWPEFMIPCYVIFTPLLGYGAARLWNLFQPQAQELLRQGRLVAGRVHPVSLAVLAVLALALNVVITLPGVDQSQNTAYEQNGRALLERADPGAWLIMPSPGHLESFYYSWALRYLSLAEDMPPDLRVITPADLNPPPGPEPYYTPWAEVEPLVAGDQIFETRPQILVIDIIDDPRTGQWALLPVCLHGEVAGYEVVAALGSMGYEPLVSDERWAQISGYVLYGGGAPTCPLDGL